MLNKILLLALSANSAMAAVSALGGGSWKSVSPGHNTQTCEGGKVNGMEFILPSTPNGDKSGSGCSNGHLRAEFRYTNDYSSGTHQFGGQFKINSFEGTGINLKQTFNGDAGPYFIMGVKSNGDLYSVEGGATIASGVAKAGSTVTINTIHYTSTNTYKVYVNNALKYTDTSAPGGTFYDKIGAYTSDSGKGPIDVTWSNVAFWTQ